MCVCVCVWSIFKQELTQGLFYCGGIEDEEVTHESRFVRCCSILFIGSQDVLWTMLFAKSPGMYAGWPRWLQIRNAWKPSVMLIYACHCWASLHKCQAGMYRTFLPFIYFSFQIQLQTRFFLYFHTYTDQIVEIRKPQFWLNLPFYSFMVCCLMAYQPLRAI